MLEVFLAVVFIVHASAFGYFYLARGRRLYNLLFLPGFLLLTAHYGSKAWLNAAGDGGEPWVWLRYAGLAVVALASLVFIGARVRVRGRRA